MKKLYFLYFISQAIFSLEGKVEYPEYVPFYLHNMSQNLPETKTHLEKLVSVLWKDQLSLLKSVSWEIKYPRAISYPPNTKEEDPFFVHFTKEKKTLPLKIFENSQKIIEPLEIYLEKKGGFHLFWGLSPNLKEKEKPLQLAILLYQEKNKILEKKISLVENEILEKITELSQEIRMKILEENSNEMDIQTQPDRASFYLNGVFLGKTPLSIKAISKGIYELSLQKEGYQPFKAKLELGENQKVIINETLTPEEGEASLEIETDPPGAKIYLDALYKGKTPLRLQNLPFGKARLRLFLEGYQEKIHIAELSKENPHLKLNFSLSPEKRAGFFKANPEVLGPFTYYDFFIAGLFVSGSLAGGALYYAVQRDNTRDKMLSELSTVNPNFFTEHDKEIYEKRNQEIKRYSIRSNLFLFGSGISLLGSFYFFFRYLASYEPPIAYNPSKQNYFAFSLSTQENQVNWQYIWNF